jgi:superfamily II DNA/RNA helicase
MLAGRLLRLSMTRRPAFKMLAGFSKIKLDSTTMKIPKIEEMDLHEETKSMLIDRGFSELFPIQYATYKDVSAGKDLIARDKTGSGKTLAYTLPLTERLREFRVNNPNAPRCPKVLVLLPTRELALQVSSEFEKLSHSMTDHITQAFYGGVSYGAQVRAIRDGFDILVATPGRLQDHITRKSIDLSQIETVVLDETDEMLEIGFKDAIFKILEYVRSQATTDKKLQYLLFSATVPQWVKTTANEFLSKDYKFVDMVQSEDIATPKNIKHIMYKVDYESQILESLSTIVDTYAGMDGKCIIFTNTKREADNIIKGRIVRASAKALHGDISQNEREAICKEFRDGDLQCLIATNVAARGVDFPKVDLVVQVKPPNDVESFVHRSGRTGRAGKNGTCVLIYDQSSSILVRQLQRVAKINFEALNPAQLSNLKIKASDNFRKYVMKGLESITEEQLDQGNDLVNELIEQHGESDALKKLVAYITLNPLERSNLRPKSQYSQDKPSFSQDRPSYGQDSRVSYGRERAPYGQERDGYNRESQGRFEDKRPPRREKIDVSTLEAPSDLTKSIFVGGISSGDQVAAMIQELENRDIGLTLDHVRYPDNNSGKLGFGFATPETTEDYYKILKLERLNLDDTFIRFSPKAN